MFTYFTILYYFIIIKRNEQASWAWSWIRAQKTSAKVAPSAATPPNTATSDDSTHRASIKCTKNGSVRINNTDWILMLELALRIIEHIFKPTAFEIIDQSKHAGHFYGM